MIQNTIQVFNFGYVLRNKVSKKIPNLSFTIHILFYENFVSERCKY